MIVSLQRLKYNSVTFDDLTSQIWYGDEIMSLKAVANIVNSRKTSLVDQIIEILEHLKGLYCHPHLDISNEVMCVYEN